MTVFQDYAASLAQPTLGAGTDVSSYDEMIGADGALRPGWKGMGEIVVRLTANDLVRINGDIMRFLADDGVTYGRPGQRPGPWRLDPVPLVIDSAQWQPLEVGLAQRGELLNAILVDLYGEQRLLAEGIVPSAVIFGHAGFSRIVARDSMRDPRPLVLAATDLGRDATGEWKVLSDRTQAPSGIGYAMENRRVISRVMPELYREAGLHRMEPYFWALRSALIQSAPGDLADPRVVVLSPGTHSETAYDQAFVAATLGFPLVQGSDLIVRDSWVYLRTPGGGQERVDVILRRVDADWSDPLELRGDSQLGVAGLVEAVRRGRVRVVNGFGAGVLENPGLLPYLPAACEALLGEPLRLESVKTWWCGDPASLEYVVGHLDELNVRTIDGGPTEHAGLSRDQIRQRILNEPYRYVGHEWLSLSQSPTWSNSGGAVARPVTLRTFTLRYGSAYRPLVGGLGNVRESTFALSCSKDVWVLKESPAEADQGLADVLPMTHARSTTVLVPRALEDFYWSGRYAERAEDMLRLVLAAHALAEDFRTRPRTTGGATLDVLMGAIRRLGGSRHDDHDDEFRSLLLDDDRPGSVAQSLDSLRDALQSVRDQLSLDTWRTFAMTDRAAELLRSYGHSHQIAESAGQMLSGMLSLQGVATNMIRDAGWHMQQLGHSIERAVQLCYLLRSTTTVRRGIDVDRQVLSAVLLAAESSVTHRRRYRGYVRTGGVLDLLLLDPDNPRSLRFALTEVRDHLDALPASTGSSRPERLLDDLTDALDATDVASLTALGGANRPNLETFLDHAIGQLTRLSEAVAEVHLATGPAPRPLDAFSLGSAT